VSTAGHGTGRLDTHSLKEYPVNIPPLPEQKKIAQILSSWDKAITTTEQLLANSQQQKKALMQQLLTGKKRLLDNNGVRFSGEWKHGHLSDLGEITKGKALSSKDLMNGDYPVIAGGKSSPYNHKEFTHENVITVSASGAYAGYVAYHPYKLWASDCSVVMEKADSDICFIYQLLSHIQSKIFTMQSGGAQPHVYPKDLEVLRVSIPVFEEQEKIAEVLSAADQETTVLKYKLNALKQEKKALMQQLLTGKRRVQVGEEH
jgi:type I restriction enzyme S subunit